MKRKSSERETIVDDFDKLVHPFSSITSTTVPTNFSIESSSPTRRKAKKKRNDAVTNNNDTATTNTSVSMDTQTDCLNWLPTATVHSFSIINKSNRDFTEMKFNRCMDLLNQLNEDKFLNEQDSFVSRTKDAGYANKVKNGGYISDIKKRLNQKTYGLSRKCIDQLNRRADKEKEEIVKSFLTIDRVPSKRVGELVLEQLNSINRKNDRSTTDNDARIKQSLKTDKGASLLVGESVLERLNEINRTNNRSDIFLPPKK